jgi:cytochrome b561
MQLTNTKAQYGAIPQLIHWFTALFVIAGWLLGQFGDDLPRGAVRAFGLYAHMTLGQCVVALLVVRLIWRVANPPPPLEATRFGWTLQLAAKLGHIAIYILLAAVPIAGIIVQLTRGRDLPVFGLWTFHSPWPADRALARSVLRVHEVLADTLLVLAGVHAAAAITHHWVLLDRTLRRMLPGTA